MKHCRAGKKGHWGWGLGGRGVGAGAEGAGGGVKQKHSDFPPHCVTTKNTGLLHVPILFFNNRKMKLCSEKYKMF